MPTAVTPLTFSEFLATMTRKIDEGEIVEAYKDKKGGTWIYPIK
jgi:hypothetical protein